MEGFLGYSGHLPRDKEVDFRSPISPRADPALSLSLSKGQTLKVMVSFGEPASQESNTRPWEAAGVLGVASLGTAGHGMPSQGLPAWAPSYPGTFREPISVGWCRRQQESAAPKSRSPLPTQRCGSLPAPSLARALCSSNNLIRFPRQPIEMRLTSACTRACGPSEAIPEPDPGSRGAGTCPGTPHPVPQPGQSAEGS